MVGVPRVQLRPRHARRHQRHDRPLARAQRRQTACCGLQPSACIGSAGPGCSPVLCYIKVSPPAWHCTAWRCCPSPHLCILYSLACAVNLTIHRCRERQTLLAAIPGKRVRSCACTILKLAREPCRSWNRNQDAISTTADQVYIVRPNATTCPNKAQGGANLAFVASAPSLTPRTGARRLQSVF